MSSFSFFVEHHFLGKSVTSNHIHPGFKSISHDLVREHKETLMETALAFCYFVGLLDQSLECAGTPREKPKLPSSNGQKNRPKTGWKVASRFERLFWFLGTKKQMVVTSQRYEHIYIYIYIHMKSGGGDLKL